jgi:hypothetical protein
MKHWWTYDCLGKLKYSEKSLLHSHSACHLSHKKNALVFNPKSWTWQLLHNHPMLHNRNVLFVTIKMQFEFEWITFVIHLTVMKTFWVLVGNEHAKLAMINSFFSYQYHCREMSLLNLACLTSWWIWHILQERTFIFSNFGCIQAHIQFG